MSSDHVDEHFIKHRDACIFVFGALLVLTFVTVWVSYFHFGHLGNILVALSIASFKALLVAAYFMHLNAEKRTIFQIIAITIFFFFDLMLVTLFAFKDQLFS